MGSNTVDCKENEKLACDSKQSTNKSRIKQPNVGHGSWSWIGLRRHFDGNSPVDQVKVLCSSSGSRYKLQSNIMDEKSTNQKSQLKVWRASKLVSIPDSDDFQIESDLVIKEFHLNTYGNDSVGSPLQEIELMYLIHERYSKENGKIGLVHPNIMHFLECFTTSSENSLFMVMPHFPGQELFDYVSAGALTEEIVKLILRQLLPALSFLHRCGIAHRDLTLDNVLFNRDNGQVMLIDLGLSTLLKRDKTCQLNYPTIHKESEVKDYSVFFREHAHVSAVGKLPYLAPEILSRANVSRTLSNRGVHLMQSDIWSLGVLLITAVIGTYLFDRAAADNEGYMFAVSQCQLSELLSAWNVNVSSEFVDLIQNILKEHPNDRLSLSRIAQHQWMQ